MRRRHLSIVVAAVAAFIAPAGAVAKSYPVLPSVTPHYATVGSPSPLSAFETVPYWRGSYVDGLNGQTYGFKMVGADPSTTSSVTVDAEIIPVTFKFAVDGGATISADQAASWASQSPIFAPTALPSGETAQYLDAVMRSEWGKIGTGYHAELNDTGILPAQTITVPASEGAVYQTPRGTALGLANVTWFSAQLRAILSDAHVSATTLPIVFSSDVLLYQNSIFNCCILGFHGAEFTAPETVQTYAWSSWIPPLAIFPPGLTDVAGLSHEIAEWGHDPFGDNYVNPWRVPLRPLLGCSNVLETGDPLVGVDFAAGSTNPDPATGPAWHLQDEAFLWWFERQQTQASNGAYSYLGTFAAPAPAC